MKKIYLLLFLQLLSYCQIIQAQKRKSTTTVPIIECLQSKDSGSDGSIQILSDPNIEGLLLGTSPQQSNMNTKDTQNPVKMMGFRIQIFSGNHPRKSKDEAFSKKRMIESQFSDLATYVTYRSPVWRLRVGNFQSREDAARYMQELKKTFPEFAREMTVSPDEIKLAVVE